MCVSECPRNKNRGSSGGAGLFSASDRRRFRLPNSVVKWASVPESSTTGGNACGIWMRPAQGSQITPSGSLQSASTISGDDDAFLPVSIIHRSTTTELEIELVNGCVVRLKGSVDVGLLQAAIIAAGQLSGSGQGDH